MFCNLFKGLMIHYRIPVSDLAMRIDRHPSRIRHWMNDCKPGKMIIQDLVTVLTVYIEAGGIDTFRDFIYRYVCCDLGLLSLSSMDDITEANGVFRELMIKAYQYETEHIRVNHKAVYPIQTVLSLQKEMDLLFKKYEEILAYDEFVQYIEMICKTKKKPMFEKSQEPSSYHVSGVDEALRQIVKCG